MADPTADAARRTPAEVGLRVVHRRYVPYAHAHYAGNLVDGAYSLAAFGDVATEMCIRTDGDEGLFASYSDVQFRERIKAGDVIEISAEIVRVGSRSRELSSRCSSSAAGTPNAASPPPRCSTRRSWPRRLAAPSSSPERHTRAPDEGPATRAHRGALGRRSPPSVR